MTYIKNIASIEAEIQISGKYLGRNAYAFQIIGRRAGFTSTSVMNDIKEFDNAVAEIPVLSNSTLDILSSSVNDTNTAGTGVRKVKVVYINNSNNLVESADINLNGTTLVTSVLTGVNQVLWMEATNWGSGGVAAGDIRLRINGGTVEVEQISTGGNKSLSARVMIPTGYKGYITGWRSTAISSNQRLRLRAQVNTLDRTISTGYHFQDIMQVPAGLTSSFEIPWLQFPALCNIKIATISSATAAANTVDVSYTLILIAD